MKLMTIELDARIVAHAVALQWATPGFLARRLEVHPAALTSPIRRLVAAGALDLSTSACHTQLGIGPGAPEAIAPLIPHDPSGVLDGWVTIRRARRGDGSQALSSLDEVGIVARRYRSKTRCAWFLMPEPNMDAWRFLDAGIITICQDLAWHNVRVGMVVPRSYIDQAAAKPLLDAVAATDALLRTSCRIDAPLLLWSGIGVIHLVAPTRELLLQTEAVEPAEAMVRACFEAADPVSRVCPSEVIRLLASGLTDAVAARRLGISERQFRRHVSRLMSQLDANSRFQAGIEAARSIQW